MSGVTLRPYQIEHYQRLIRILKTKFGYMDTSKMGCGKTYITMAVSLYYKIPLFVVCPKSAKSVWTQASKETGVTPMALVSFDQLRSKKGCQPKHGYLLREEQSRRTLFHVTPRFQKWVQKGLLVVIDESQFTRNNTDQFKAVKALLNYVVFHPSRSRFALLTGSPLDKEEQVVNLLRMIGYIRAAKLYQRDRTNGNIILYGLQELIDACETIDRAEVGRILAEFDYHPRHMKTLVHQLYSRVLKKEITSSAPAPPIESVRLDIANGYYRLEGKEKEEEFLQAIADLETVSKYKKELEKDEQTEFQRGKITTARRVLELLKGPTFHRKAQEYLEANLSCKVIVGVHFLITLDLLEKALSKYEPLILKGEVKEDDRAHVLHEFQNNPKKRLLLMIVQVGSVSISLHDTTGYHPRILLLSPSYKLLEMYQATGRVYRDGTKSDVLIRFVYLKVGVLETSILASLARKSTILKSVLQERDVKAAIFPGDYPSEYEEEDPLSERISKGKTDVSIETEGYSVSVRISERV